MCRLIQILGILFISISAIAQSNYEIPDYYNPDKSKSLLSDSLLFTDFQKKKIKFGVEMGTTIGTLNGQSAFTSYVSPYAFYPLSDRFSIEVGTSIARGNSIMAFNPYFGESLIPLGQNMLQTSIYARGRYQVNNNLSVFGTAYVQRNIFLKPTEGEEQMSFDTRAMSFGMEYKLGPHASIKFEMQTGNSFYPGFQNQTGMFQNPAGMFNQSNLNPARQ
ncbi:MAG: hypothetical protein U9R19_10855 [Bacteroidota bacterium]|nr:hypothetical protein [Bacteroidota bacterium]